MELLDANGDKIKTPRDTASGLVVPFASASHAFEVGTAVYCVMSNIEDSPLKTTLKEALDDIAYALDAYKKKGGVVQSKEMEAKVLMNTSPAKLDLV